MCSILSRFRLACFLILVPYGFFGLWNTHKKELKVLILQFPHRNRILGMQYIRSSQLVLGWMLGTLMWYQRVCYSPMCHAQQPDGLHVDQYNQFTCLAQNYTTRGGHVQTINLSSSKDPMLECVLYVWTSQQ